MNLHRMLVARAAERRPLRVGLIGAGKFGSMYVAQAKHTPGIHVVAVADLAPDRAKASLARTGWEQERTSARSFAAAAASGATFVADDALALIAAPEVEIVIDATGNPAAGISARPRLLSRGQARGDGQRRGRRARRTAPRSARARRGHRLLARVRRPARVDLRARRLVPHRGVRGRRRGQGHQVPARVSRVDAGYRVAALRIHARGRRGRRLQRADVQLVPGRHEERDRDGRGRQRDGSDAGAFGSRVSSVRRRRSAARAAPGRRRGTAPPRRTGRGDLQRGARRPARLSRLALGCLRDVSRRRRRGRAIRSPLLCRIRILDRSVRALLGDVQAVSRDRTRARRERGVGRLAGRADGRGDRMARRRRRDGETRSRGRRDARRRGRLHGLRKADARRRVALPSRPAARTRARRAPRAKRRRARDRFAGTT